MEQTTAAAFLDFRKAFDTVPHGALLAKLIAMGLPEKLLRFVGALYAAPKPVIRLGIETTEPFRVESCLGPLCILFLLLTRPIGYALDWVTPRRTAKQENAGFM